MASLRTALVCQSLRRTSNLTRNSFKTQCTRKFHNGPPKNPHGENPWPYPTQSKVFWSGLTALTASCIFAYSVDLFKPKFGELDWDKIREERMARRAEEMDEDEEEEAEVEEEVAAEVEEEEVVDIAEEVAEEEAVAVPAEPVEESIEAVEEYVEAVEEYIEAVEVAAEESIEAVEEYVEAVEEYIEAVEESIEAAEEAVEAAEEAVEESIEAVEEVVEAVEEVVEAVEEVVEAVVLETAVEEPVAVVEEPAPVDESFDVIEVAEVAEAAAATEEIAGTAPAAVDKVPEKVQYLLIGAGTSSVSAMRAILKNDPQAEILMIGSEPHPPYMRPPLSKELWFSEDKEATSQMVFKDWGGKERSLFYPDAMVEAGQMSPGNPGLMTNTRVVKLDPTSQCVTLSSGEKIAYEKCLLAPGGDPKSLGTLKHTKEMPCLLNRVHLFRNIQQFQQLSSELSADTKVLVVGGGFLGSELAYAITRTGAEVYQTFPESGNMGKVLPKYLSSWTTKELQRASVNVIADTKVIGSSCKDNGMIEVALNNGTSVDVDHVLVAVGLEPSTELGDNAGLEVHSEMGGYVVNAELEARSNLYVAGDAACFYDPILGRRRVEHHDHAVVSGKLAGENMAGATKPYHHQSMFWSDLGPNIGYEAIGLIDSSLPTVGIWAHNDKPSVSEIRTTEPSGEEHYEKGVVFYMRKNQVVGVVTWNIFGKIPIARKVIGAGEEHTDFGVLAKQFDIHSTQ